MIKHQNGSFSLEIDLIRLNFGEATGFDALCLCPLFFRTFTPRDTVRGSIRKGQLDAHRTMGYWGEENRMVPRFGSIAEPA